MTRVQNIILVCSMILIIAACNSSFDNSRIVEYVENNDSIKVEKWLKDGGNPNILLPDSCTLLYYATGPRGGLAVTKLLVDAGANVDKGVGKYTPLMNAACWIAYDCVKYLLDHKANPNLINEDGKTALQGTGSCNGCSDEIMTKSLLKKVTKPDK